MKILECEKKANDKYRYKIRYNDTVIFRTINHATKQVKWQYENYTRISESKSNKLEQQWQKEILI